MCAGINLYVQNIIASKSKTFTHLNKNTFVTLNKSLKCYLPGKNPL